MDIVDENACRRGGNFHDGNRRCVRRPDVHPLWNARSERSGRKGGGGGEKLSACHHAASLNARDEECLTHALKTAETLAVQVKGYETDDAQGDLLPDPDLQRFNQSAFCACI